MCIIADNVNDVSETKIASFHVGFSKDDGKTVIPSQLVVYSANVDSVVKSNAFILPVYNPGNKAQNIIPLDLSDYENFFEEADNVFRRWFPQIKSMANNVFANSFDIYDDLLEVHKVGDYEFSVLPSKIDFNKIDRSKLNIDSAAKITIDMHSDDYSFIVFQFYQKGKLKITPFGYLCKPYDDNSMIIPTIHGHPHDSLLNLGTGYVPNMHINFKHNFQNDAEFDHDIYCLIKSTKNNIVDKKDIVDLNRLLKKISKDYLNQKVRLYSPLNFFPKKLRLEGNKLNRNLMINKNGHQYFKDLTFDQYKIDNPPPTMMNDYKNLY